MSGLLSSILFLIIGAVLGAGFIIYFHPKINAGSSAISARNLKTSSFLLSKRFAAALTPIRIPISIQMPI
jgi:hypothetical protein